MKDDSSVRYRMTKQKRVILEVLKDTKSHPTADWVYEKVRRKIPNISLGTVYRNLNILKNQGEILELSYGKGYSRYDGTPENHYHFTCESCGKVYDVDCPVADSLEDEVTSRMGYKVKSHRLEFYGICNDCDTHKDQ